MQKGPVETPGLFVCLFSEGAMPTDAATGIAYAGAAGKTITPFLKIRKRYGSDAPVGGRITGRANFC
jgi:hypothetical protein